MKTDHYLMIGGAIALAALIKTSNGKSVLENIAGSVGSGIGGSIPTAASAAVGAFVETSYNTGFDTGVKTSQALMPTAQKIAAQQGITLSTPQPTLAEWEKQYAQQTNPLINIPVLGDISNLWHVALTNNWW